VGLRQAGPRWGSLACCPVVAAAAEVSVQAAAQSEDGMASPARPGHAKPAGRISINPAGRRERQSRKSCTVVACTGNHVQVGEMAIGGTHGQVSPRMPMVTLPGNTSSQSSGNRCGPERDRAALGHVRRLHSWRGPGSVQPGHGDAALIAHRTVAARLMGIARVGGATVTGQGRDNGADAADCDGHNENPAHGPRTGLLRHRLTVCSGGPNGDTP
jgi:hypothetical protein